MSESKKPPASFPSADELVAAGWMKVSRRTRQIASRPRVGQYFWVDFPHDAYAPEFEGEHPGVVVRAAQSLSDTCIVVPVTSQTQESSAHVHVLGRNPNPVGSAQGKVAHAICNHLYTVHVNRLRPILTAAGTPVFGKIDPGDLEAILTKVRNALSYAPLPKEAPQMTIETVKRPLGPNTLTLKGKP